MSTNSSAGTKPGVRGIDFACLYDFSIVFWNCSSSVLFLVFHFIPSLSMLPSMKVAFNDDWVEYCVRIQPYHYQAFFQTLENVIL